MEQNDLPLGLSFALGQNPRAMRNFALLSDARRTELLQKAQAVSSKNEMQSLIRELSAQG